MRVRGVVTALVAGLALAISACGGESGSGTVSLNFWAYNEPGGTFRAAAERCTAESNGAYRINFNALGNDPNTQRQQLVRRLAAGDSSIDIMSMDVIWTAEFAEAGWIKPFPEDVANEIRQGTLKGPLDTATYDGKLYGAPANSNTQLLWYRKDLVPNPPTTWSEMIDMAEKMKEAGRVETMGDAYEGLVVWFNSLVQSAGGQILSSPDEVALQPDATRKALDIMGRLGRSKAADPSFPALREDQARLAFETGNAAFQVNWPFIYPSARDNKAPIFKDIGWAPWPRVDANTPSRAPIGGFNWGVGGNTEHPDQAFQAAACMRNEANQRDFALKGGLPPTLEALYDDPAFKKDYPFADVIRTSLENAAVRPRTPVYSDVSQAIFTTLHPPSSVRGSEVDRLRKAVENALKGEALL
jgi:ABC-type glycerol-3-phosphate transport system substrate-binding protein